MGSQVCNQYNRHIPLHVLRITMITRITWWKWTFYFHENGNTPLNFKSYEAWVLSVHLPSFYSCAKGREPSVGKMPAKPSWEKAAPCSRMTLHSVVNVGYSVVKGDPQQGVCTLWASEREQEHSSSLQTFYLTNKGISQRNKGDPGQRSALLAAALLARFLPLLIFLCLKVLCKDTGQREGENRKDWRKSEMSKGLSRKQLVISNIMFWKSDIFSLSLSSTRFWKKSYPASCHATTDLVESPKQGHTPNRLRGGAEHVSWLFSGMETVYWRSPDLEYSPCGYFQ